MRSTHPTKPAVGLLALLLSLLALAGCRDVPVDDFEYEGGTAPEPTGVVQGTVLYSGPPPICQTDEDGNVVPVGNVILTLFEFDNPPPPAGSASSAANLHTIPGISFFEAADCLPADPTPEDFAFITRTAEFTWPELPLGGAYQIRGFFDYDGNFNPFFSVTNIPTAGDIGGGAFVDPQATLREYRRIAFESEELRPNGQVINGVSVALGAPVNTERPVFYLTSDDWLDSAGTLPTTTDLVARENAILDATGTTLHLYDAEKDGAAFDALAAAFAAAGMPVTQADGSYDPRGFRIGDLDGDDVSHAWYVRPVDADGDGAQDLHPTLGSAGVNWLTPIVIMQRIRSAAETEAGIPSVLMVPTVSNVAFLLQGKRVYDDEIAIGVPPISAVQLNPADARCQIPFIPSGNTTRIYERITVECQEVPTGLYGVNALQGLAGARQIGGAPGAEPMCTPPDSFPDGTPIPEFLAEDGCFDYPELPPETARQLERCNGDNRCAINASFTGTGYDLEGGTYSSQNWGVPNALGDPSQIPDVTGTADALTPAGQILFAQQGLGGAFAVTDSDGASIDGGADCSMALDDDDESPTFGTVRAVNYRVFSEYFEARTDLDEAGKESARQDLQDLCCEPVAHLCGIPLCPLVAPPTHPDAQVRAGITSVEGGVPNCVPFEIPDFCCPGIP